MNDLLAALRERASADAAAFREKFPDQQPNEKWMDNSFTAALPLAASAAGVELGNQARPELFAAYKQAVASQLGMTRPPSADTEFDRKSPDGGQIQEPTAGEH